MKIAIPVTGGRLSAHFGHCERFALIDVDTAERKILSRVDIEVTVRRRVDAVGAIPEIDPVQVHLEDLVLGVFRL